MEGKRLPLPCVHQHDGFGDARTANDVVPIAHHSQPTGTRGNETCILMDHDQRLEPFNGYSDVRGSRWSAAPSTPVACSRCYRNCGGRSGHSARHATVLATSLLRAPSEASA